MKGVLQGIEMGVAPDGSTFLSQRGVANLCGVVPSAVTALSQELVRGDRTPRADRMRIILHQLGWSGLPYTPVPIGGQVVHAYPDVVVVAFLQYYAFESRAPSERAVRALALLATKTLRELIYAALGVAPPVGPDGSWKAIHERLLLNPIPAGWFSVFAESAPLLIAAKRGGLDVGSHTVPDVSIGQRWSAWWTERRLGKTYGDRRLHSHRYPDDHPQSRANGSIEAYIYPVAALGVFRAWLEDEYLPTYFPRYLEGQVAKKAIASGDAHALVTALAPRRLPR